MSLSLVVFIVTLLIGVAMVLDGIKIIRTRVYVPKKYTGLLNGIPFVSKLEPMTWAGTSAVPVGISVCLSGLIFIVVSLLGIVYSSNNILGGIAIMGMSGVLVQAVGGIVALFMRD